MSRSVIPARYALSEFFETISSRGMPSYWYMIDIEGKKYSNMRHGTLEGLLGIDSDTLVTILLASNLTVERRSKLCLSKNKWEEFIGMFGLGIELQKSKITLFSDDGKKTRKEFWFVRVGEFGNSPRLSPHDEYNSGLVAPKFRFPSVRRLLMQRIGKFMVHILCEEGERRQVEKTTVEEVVVVEELGVPESSITPELKSKYPLLLKFNILPILINQDIQGDSCKNLLREIVEFMDARKIDLEYEHMNGKKSRLLRIPKIGHLDAHNFRDRLQRCGFIQNIIHILSNFDEQLHSRTAHHFINVISNSYESEFVDAANDFGLHYFAKPMDPTETGSLMCNVGIHLSQLAMLKK